jgi:hypothetical protein
VYGAAATSTHATPRAVPYGDCIAVTTPVAIVGSDRRAPPHTHCDLLRGYFNMLSRYLASTRVPLED